MIYQGILDQPVFSFYIGNTSRGTNSICTLGGIDETAYEGEMIRIPLRRKFFGRSISMLSLLARRL